MAKNQVTLTFAGDADKLERASQRAGASLEQLGDDARSASQKLDTVGDAAGTVDTRAMGFRDAITGVSDVTKALGDDSLSTSERLFTLGMGIGDLASAVENLGVHMLKSAATTAKAAAMKIAAMAKATAAMVAQVARQVAAWVLLGVQSLLHAAKVAAAWLIAMGPIGIVVAAVIALVVLIIKNWDTIKAVISKGWEFVKRITVTVWNGIKAAVMKVLDLVKAGIRRYVNIYVGIFRTIVSGARRVFGGITSAIVAPFRNAVQGIKSTWNRLIGGKGFSVPSWIPGVGGKSFKIPRLAQGGVLMPRPGGVPFIGAEAGRPEAVIPLDRLERMMASPREEPTTVVFGSDGSTLGDLLLEVLREAVSIRGGNAQAVIGS